MEIFRIIRILYEFIAPHVYVYFLKTPPENVTKSEILNPTNTDSTDVVDPGNEDVDALVPEADNEVSVIFNPTKTDSTDVVDPGNEDVDENHPKALVPVADDEEECQSDGPAIQASEASFQYCVAGGKYNQQIFWNFNKDYFSDKEDSLEKKTMKGIARSLQTKYRHSYAMQSEQLIKIGVFQNNDDIISWREISELFLPVHDGNCDPVFILGIDKDKSTIFGQHMACLWGTREETFLDDFSLVITVYESLSEEIKFISDLNKCEDSILHTTNDEILVIVLNFDSLKPEGKEELRNIFAFKSQPFRNATFFVINSSIPEDMSFDKKIICQFGP